ILDLRWSIADDADVAATALLRDWMSIGMSFAHIQQSVWSRRCSMVIGETIDSNQNLCILDLRCSIADDADVAATALLRDWMSIGMSFAHIQQSVWSRRCSMVIGETIDSNQNLCILDLRCSIADDADVAATALLRDWMSIGMSFAHIQQSVWSRRCSMVIGETIDSNQNLCILHLRCSIADDADVAATALLRDWMSIGMSFAHTQQSVWSRRCSMVIGETISSNQNLCILDMRWSIADDADVAATALLRDWMSIGMSF